MTKFQSIIIDDEPKLRKVIEVKLGQNCNEIQVVDTAENIDIAYQKITTHKPDIIFLDISMPGGSGFDLLQRFETIDFEVIFVTALRGGCHLPVKSKTQNCWG